LVPFAIQSVRFRLEHEDPGADPVAFVRKRRKREKREKGKRGQPELSDFPERLASIRWTGCSISRARKKGEKRGSA
jgi:hypothetical protein